MGECRLVTWSEVSISSAACAGQLALALVALRRSIGSRLALPLALLFLDIFTWNLASLLENLWGQPVWAWLDHTASSFTVPLALEFVFAFVGRQRRSLRLRILCWIPFAALSLLPTLGLFFPLARRWDQSGVWAGALAACVVPAMSLAIALLVRHLRETADPHERARTRLLLAATALATALGLTDLVSNFVPGLPSLAALGVLAAGAIVMFAATRERLLESDVTVESAVTSLALAAVGVVAYITLFRLAASHTAILVLGTTLLTLTMVAVIRQLARTSAARRARALQLAHLGRFSAQMAHDFKNPLAALKGAAQFLKEDLPRQEPGARRAAFVDLMLEQITRLEDAIDAYGRLARVEPLRSPVQINDLVREAVDLQPLAAGQRVSLRAELAEGLPACSADGRLLANALQNLIRNACEAIEGEGSVTLRTARSGESEPPGVVISVEDTGAGMDARTQERAFDEFFTTKPTGSGLGLPFVRRVVEAHGGTVSIASRQRRGTVVRIRLPLGEEGRCLPGTGTS